MMVCGLCKFPMGKEDIGGFKSSKGYICRGCSQKAAYDSTGQANIPQRYYAPRPLPIVQAKPVVEKRDRAKEIFNSIPLKLWREEREETHLAFKEFNKKYFHGK